MNLTTTARAESLAAHQSREKTGVDTSRSDQAEDFARIDASRAKGDRFCAYLFNAAPRVQEGDVLGATQLITIDRAIALRLGKERVTKCYFGYGDVTLTGADGVVQVARCTVGKDMLECSL